MLIFIFGKFAFCKSDNLLIIRPDGIGDYILFRNFLPYIRKSTKFNNYKITLLGNINYRTLAETLDAEFIDKFIWINNNLLYRKTISGLIYTIKINLQLSEKKFKYIFYPVFSRTNIYDKLIMNLNANEKITCSGDKVNKKNVVDITDKVYSQVIPNTPQYGLFEFVRNKEIISGFLNEKIDIKHLVIEKFIDYRNCSLPNEFVAICMEASNLKKRWQEEYFHKVISYILKVKNLPVVLLGLENNKINIPEYDLYQTKIIDLRKKTSIHETAYILSKSFCFIGNDSALIHIAAAAGIKKMIAICYGAYYGRFAPYPDIDGRNYRFIFPPEIQKNLDNSELLKKKYSDGLFEDINLITPQIIIDIINEFI